MIGTLVPTGTECAPDEGPIQSVAGDKAVGWLFNLTDGGFTITVAPGTVPDNTTEKTIYLVYDPEGRTVMWKRVGGIIAETPENSVWSLVKVPE